MSALSGNVDSRRPHVTVAQGICVVPTTPPPPTCYGCFIHAPRGFCLRLADERADGGVRCVANDEVQVVTEDFHCVNAHSSALGCGEGGLLHGSDIRFGNARLPTPRVPGDVRIQANCTVHSVSRHWRALGGLTPGPCPGVQSARARPMPGWVNAGAMPRGSRQPCGAARTRVTAPYPHTSHPWHLPSCSPKCCSSIRRRHFLPCT